MEEWIRIDDERLDRSSRRCGAALSGRRAVSVPFLSGAPPPNVGFAPGTANRFAVATDSSGL